MWYAYDGQKTVYVGPDHPHPDWDDVGINNMFYIEGAAMYSDLPESFWSGEFDYFNLQNEWWIQFPAPMGEYKKGCSYAMHHYLNQI